MGHSVTIAIIATAALALGGCSQGAVGGGGHGDAKKAIQADEAKFVKQMKAKDTEGVIGHYADDAYFVAPGAPAADGSTAVRQVFATASTDPAFELSFASDKVDVAKSGDLAYSRGKFTEQYTDRKTSKVMTAGGSYLTVYRKQDDGWKIVADFAATDPDSVKPVPPKAPATHAKMTSF